MPIVNPLPNTIANGQLEDAVPVMANFNWLVSQINGNACPATAGSGMLKGNGAGGTTAAVAGTDYAGIGSANAFTALQSGIGATSAANFPIASQVQQSAFNTGVTGGTPDAITAVFSPIFTSLVSAPVWWRATAANTTTTPTFKRDGLIAKTIVKSNNVALVAGDIPGAGAWMCSQYDATLDKEVLLNPAHAITATNIAGGTSGSLPYQTAVDATGMLPPASNGQFLTLVAGIPAWGNPVTVSTVQLSTSGTSILFTGIPSTAKRVVVMFENVSTNGVGQTMIQLGTSGGLETTGYVSSAFRTNGIAIANTGSTSGLLTGYEADAANVRNGLYILEKLTGNTWVGNGMFAAAVSQTSGGAGSKTLAGTLTQINITTTSGDTFDLGQINISWE